MLNPRYFSLTAFAIALLVTACESDLTTKNLPPQKEISKPPSRLAPEFNADSAYQFVKKQLEFGPRIPGTQGHKNCSDYIVNELKKYTSDLQYNGGKITAYDGKIINVQNIIASFNKENTKRIMISAHYDTRPWADNDKLAENHQKPVPGANDGASGVAVMLEIARQFSQKNPGVGLDLMFWDAEDYGQISGEIENTFCYGSQYWAKNKHVNGYKAEFGINLDMVGAAGARFSREGFSRQYASQFVDLVWGVGRELGYSNYFVNELDGPITDDHYYVNTMAGIPCIDIIDRPPGKGSFFVHWHTVNDDLSVIHVPTLKAVGQTVLEVIYRQGKPN